MRGVITITIVCSLIIGFIIGLRVGEELERKDWMAGNRKVVDGRLWFKREGGWHTHDLLPEVPKSVVEKPIQ